MKAKKIEAEGSELILRNEHGDYAIIPKKHRLEITDMVKEGCNNCIDAFVEALPTMNDYAEGGTLFPASSTKINLKNPVYEEELMQKKLLKNKLYTEAQAGNVESDRKFREIFKTSPHKYRYDNDSEYRNYYDNLIKNSSEKIQYPDDSPFRKDAIPVNMRWMYPQLSDESAKNMGDFSNEVIGSALPIPVVEQMGKIPSVFKAVENLAKPGKAANKIADASKVRSIKNNISNVDNILPNLPDEVILGQPSISTINLERMGSKSKKIHADYDDVDLGGDLILRNNPNRVFNKEDIIGKKYSIASVKNTKTNEYVDLKSWLDEDGQIYYYMSANMPSSKIKAGRAYMELEKKIPKGSSILENASLSIDSYTNIIKQLKNPKFESSVKGKVTLNNMGVNKKVPNSHNQSIFARQDKVLFDDINNAQKSVDELNILLKENNLPEATIITEKIWVQPQAHLPYMNKEVYGIELPNIALKKLYTVLGITGGARALNKLEKNQK